MIRVGRMISVRMIREGSKYFGDFGSCGLKDCFVV
jgi:hypothetical protein